MADFGRQNALFDQEYVGVEPGAFVARPDLRHKAVDVNRSAIGQLPPKRDYIIQLKILLGCERYPE